MSKSLRDCRSPFEVLGGPFETKYSDQSVEYVVTTEDPEVPVRQLCRVAQLGTARYVRTQLLGILTQLLGILDFCIFFSRFWGGPPPL